MRRRGVPRNRGMQCFEAKNREALTKTGPLRNPPSKSLPKSDLMASSSDLPYISGSCIEVVQAIIEDMQNMADHSGKIGICGFWTPSVHTAIASDLSIRLRSNV